MLRYSLETCLLIRKMDFKDMISLLNTYNHYCEKFYVHSTR